MKNALGLSIIIMLFCFNIGMLVIDTAGLYEGTDIDYEAGDVYDPTASYSGKAFNILAVLGLGSLFGLAGAIIAKAAGMDPLRAGTISGFVGFMIPMYNSTTGVVLQFAEDITGAASIAVIIAGIFLTVNVIFIGLFIYQIATNGWQSLL